MLTSSSKIHLKYMLEIRQPNKIMMQSHLCKEKIWITLCLNASLSCTDRYWVMHISSYANFSRHFFLMEMTQGDILIIAFVDDCSRQLCYTRDIEHFFNSHKLSSAVMLLMTLTSRSLNFDIFQMPGYPFDVYGEHSNRCVRK